MMQQRREARRAAALSVFNTPSVPTSPVYSSKRLMNRLSHSQSQHDSGSSSSSSSPDSLYSNSSPTLPDPAFEYDGSEEIQQHDESEYESLMAESAGWQTPAWGTWPEIGGDGADWTPSPTHHSPSGGTIISISPAGSLNGRRGSRGSPSIFRSGGTGKTHSDSGRRGSDPSLLGFNLNSPDRRRLPPSRRRSSVLSNGSVMDPVEDARLRNIASMSMLRRRFSEVVEVSGAELEQGDQDTFVARRIMSQWSPYTDVSDADDDDDASEIHTAPYIPTPPVQHGIPSVLSNFPLASIAAAPDYADTSSELLMSRMSSPGSPTFNARPLPRIPLAPPPRNFATPPPADQPSTLLRERVRPTLARAMTNYHFPPLADGIPTGTAKPRPALHRSTSTPFFSASANGRDAASLFASVHGIPQQRIAPLGVSPLRASLRRQSVVSDVTESRRASLADSRRPSLSIPGTDRRLSVVKDRSVDDLRRLSMDRRLSIEVRRLSVDGRKMDSRKASVDGRKMSAGNGLGMSMDGRKMSLDRTIDDYEARSTISPIRESRRSSNMTIEERRRSSAVSRKSSVVSIGEYGYLAPQIVIDAPEVSPELPELAPRLRRNAPVSIPLPEFSFPFHSASSSTVSLNGGLTSPDILTPRFNPLDSFLGKVSPNMPSTPSTIGPVSPSADDMSVTPTLPAASPRSSIMDRGRPLSPPEFRDSFLPRYRAPHSQSPKSSPKEASTPEAPPPPPPVVRERSLSPIDQPRAVSRKAVPKISSEELVVEEKRDMSMRRRRRGAVGEVDSRSALAKEVAHILEVAPLPPSPAPPISAGPPTSAGPPPPMHRRTISTGQSSVGLGRPPNRRQMTVPTLPPTLEGANERSARKSHIVFEESTWRTPAHLHSALNSPSLSLSPGPSPIPRAQSRAQSAHSPALSSSPRISLAPSPRPRADAGQLQTSPTPPPPSALEKSVLKRASVTFSETTHAIPGSSSRPTVSRASSFSRFFKSRPQSISGPLPSGTTKPVRPSLRPMSSDVSRTGYSWQG